MTHKPKPYLGVSFGTLLLGTLLACSAPRVHEQPPPNDSLAGMWELNPALSSDAAKALAALTPKPRGGPRPGHGPESGSGPPAPEVINDPTTDLPPVDLSGGGRNQGAYNIANDRNQYRPPIDFQTNELLGGEWLKIQQSDTEMRIANAARTRTYTPGERSVVSVPSGVADQESGWAGRSYIVYLAPQIGPKVQETYSLSADRRQLIVKIAVASEGNNRAMAVTRTYDRSSKDPASFHQTLQETLPPTD
jgi:hypothetical protein